MKFSNLTKMNNFTFFKSAALQTEIETELKAVCPSLDLNESFVLDVIVNTSYQTAKSMREKRFPSFTRAQYINLAVDTICTVLLGTSHREAEKADTP